MKIDLNKYGYIRVGVAVPEIEVGNPDFNESIIEQMVQEANDLKTDLLVFPELCLTGYTCADLFFQTELLEGAKTALFKLKEMSSFIKPLIIVGAPIEKDNQIFNCAIALSHGEILVLYLKHTSPIARISTRRDGLLLRRQGGVMK